MRVVGFVLAPEHEDIIERLSKQLHWSRSMVIRELLRHATVETRPRVRVVLPAEDKAGV